MVPDATWLQPSDVAQQLGKSPSAVVRWCLKGASLRDGTRIRLEATRLPQGWRIKPDALSAFLERLTADACGEKPKPRINWAEHHAAEAALDAAGW